MRKPCATAAGCRVLPGKESQNRARVSPFIAVVKMIGPGVIEVDGLFNQAQTEHLGIKTEIL